MGTMKDYVKQYQASKQKAAAPAVNVDPNSKLSYSCGHTVGVRQITDRECPECVAKRRVNRRKAQAKKQRELAPDDSGRLPDGTTINGSYDAARRMWNLQVITPDGVFEGELSSIHRLLMMLGKRGIEAANRR